MREREEFVRKSSEEWRGRRRGRKMAAVAVVPARETVPRPPFCFSSLALL